MPFESMGLRRWLLATVAAWAALVWLAGAFGLGSRIRPLPEDPALVQPLPRLAPPRAAPLQPLSRYDDIAARPLFADDRRPHPFVLSGAQDAAPQGFDFRLTGVLLTPALAMAILQPAAGGEPVRVRMGEGPPHAAEWRLTELQARSARFEGPEGVRLLELRTFNGVGDGMSSPTPSGGPAERPVPVRVPPAAAPSATPAAAPAATRDAASRAAESDAAAPEGGETEAVPVADPQAEAEVIRRRIEARRARLREQQSQGAVRDQNQ